MASVRERWLSGRAVSLHLAVLVLVPGCALAAWWQINRAAGREPAQLPVLGHVAGLRDPGPVLLVDAHPHRLRDRRPEGHAAPAGEADAADQDTGGAPPAAPHAIAGGTGRRADEDPELAAYNARLAELAAQGPKTWRSRESVVVRREQ